MSSASEVVPVGYKQTDLGTIPTDWVVRKIGELAQLLEGGLLALSPKYWGGKNWFTPTEVGNTKYLSKSKRKLTDEGFQNVSCQMLPKGAILMTSRAGIGDLGILDVPACKSRFQSLVCNSKMNNEFLYYLMSTKKGELEEKASGSTFLEISPSEVKSILVSPVSMNNVSYLKSFQSQILKFNPLRI